MLIGAILLLVVLLIALATVIILDIRRAGFRDWLVTQHGWQQTLGTVVGFLGAAGVLVLGTALTRQADEHNAAVRATAIGEALAYESERMTTGLELGRRLGQTYDPAGPDADRQCAFMADSLRQQMQTETPIFNASIAQVVDFAPDDLANFVRFYSFYAELRRAVATITPESCAGSGGAQLSFMISQVALGLSYYQTFAQFYPVVQYGPDGPISAAPQQPTPSLAPIQNQSTP